jgi:hypothetical protein
MIVEPAPTNPRSPGRRALRLVGLAAPLVLLVGIVAAGALGRPASAPTPHPSPVTATSPTPSALVALLPDGTSTPFPDGWVGLRVRTVAETQALRQAGDAEGFLAVGGYLSYGTLSPRCVDAYLDTDPAVCAGRSLFADVAVIATDATGGVFDAIGPHLHPLFADGVRAPTPGPTPGSPARGPIPVVVLGRYTDSRGVPCSPTSRDCGEAFAVERVVWVAGKPWGETLGVDAALDIEPNAPEVAATVEAASDALGQGALQLRTAVVRREVLDIVDPDAADALGPVPAGQGLRALTYVRGLVFEFDASQPLYGRDPAIGWVVVDSRTGKVLARGP